MAKRVVVIEDTESLFHVRLQGETSFGLRSTRGWTVDGWIKKGTAGRSIVCTCDWPDDANWYAPPSSLQFMVEDVWVALNRRAKEWAPPARADSRAGTQWEGDSFYQTTTGRNYECRRDCHTSVVHGLSPPVLS